jgi:hypothetical protein
MRTKRAFCNEEDPVGRITLDVSFAFAVRAWLRMNVAIVKFQVEAWLVVVVVSIIVNLALGLRWAVIFDSLSCPTIVSLLLAVETLLLVAIVLESCVFTNIALVDSTTHMLGSWRDLAMRDYRWSKDQSRSDTLCKHCAIQSPYSQAHFDDSQLHRDNFYRSMIEPLEHMILHVEKVERPVEFFGVPIDKQWRTRWLSFIMASSIAVLWPIGSSLVNQYSIRFLENELHDEQHYWSVVW